MGRSDALSHLKINSEFRHASILWLPFFVSALSMIFCIECPVLSHDNGYVCGFYGRKFSPYTPVSWLVITPEMQLIVEEEGGEERLHGGRLNEAQVNPRKASKASGCAAPGSEADPRPVKAIMGLLRKISLASLPWRWILVTPGRSISQAASVAAVMIHSWWGCLNSAI